MDRNQLHLHRLWILALAGALAFGLGACGDDADDDDDDVAGDDDDDMAGDDDDDMAGDDDDDDDLDAGPEDGGPMDEDAGPMEDCPDLAPTAFATNVVISQYRLGMFLELYNPTASDIPLTGYQVCDRSAYRAIAGTVPAEGYLQIDISGFGDSDSPDGSEMALYRNTSYEDRNAMVDYLCWGNPGSSRKSVAEMDLGAGALWSGDCGPVPTGNAITRQVSTAGTSAGDYDFVSTPDPILCPAP